MLKDNDKIGVVVVFKNAGGGMKGEGKETQEMKVGFLFRDAK